MAGEHFKQTCNRMDTYESWTAGVIHYYSNFKKVRKVQLVHTSIAKRNHEKGKLKNSSDEITATTNTQ